jgi:hypothetical protein
MPNRLARETSIHLRRHPHSPVDWRPWSTEGPRPGPVPRPALRRSLPSPPEPNLLSGRRPESSEPIAYLSRAGSPRPPRKPSGDSLRR